MGFRSLQFFLILPLIDFAQHGPLPDLEASLTQVSLSSEPVDISLHQNLDIVDKFIADCEQRIKDEPGDDLTREYLSGAYEQKAELISAMMDRRGSVN